MLKILTFNVWGLPEMAIRHAFRDLNAITPPKQARLRSIALQIAPFDVVWYERAARGLLC